MSEGTTAVASTNAARAGSSSPRWSIVLGGGLIVLAALMAYHNSFTGPFILDDVSSIARNASIHHLWPIWGVLSPPVDSLVGGRPVTNLSFAFNYALGGTAVWGYHAANLVIHILAALTLYGIVRRTLSGRALRERFGAKATGLALAVAVLWTVHPLQTEAVIYISERCESLMALFYLLTLYCFIRGVDSRRSGWWFALSAVACLLGMGSKEVMVTAPVMVLLYDRTFVSGSFREAWTRHRRLYFGLASTWVWLGHLMIGLHNRGAGYGLGITWWAYALAECRVVVNYLWLAVWPHPLVFDYGWFKPIVSVADVLPYALVLLALIAVVVYESWRESAVGFLGAWFFVILSPTTSVVPIVGQPMAEHRMYLPLAAVVTMAVMAIDARMVRRRSTAVFLLLAMGLGFLATRRNEDYRTEPSIWSDTVAKCPDNARAHGSLGRALVVENRAPEGAEQCLQAIQMRPGDPEAHYYLGLAWLQMLRSQDAIDEFEHVLRIKPDHFQAHYTLGVALTQVGRVTEAIDHYREALRLRPDYIEAHTALGNSLLRIGNEPDAVAQFQEALSIDPDYPEALSHLGDALQHEGKLDEAVSYHRWALRIKPDYVEAHFNLGLALEKLGRTPEAIEQYRQALKLRPDFAPAAQALTRLGVSQ